MVKVITYGTFDCLHFGHINLLKRAKALGDYLIVGITSDDFDKARGKINVQQPLMERLEAVRTTSIADEIIVEEYEGQKIDDVIRLGIDIFTVGSDWEGKFDYLKKYCEVIYLPRTKGISSSKIRSNDRKVRLGFIGDEESRILFKYCKECNYVNGLEISGIYTINKQSEFKQAFSDIMVTDSLEELYDTCDAVYLLSHPTEHYTQILDALKRGKHVLCESPIATQREKVEELFDFASKKRLILMDAIKTAYATAYDRLLLLIKSDRIGKIISVDATCTSIQYVQERDLSKKWNSICAWGPTAMLPVFQILGTQYVSYDIISYLHGQEMDYDSFTKINFLYPEAMATVKVGRGVKSEGEMVISGTKGYLYVPAPWWKTDYFEIRYENQSDNQRYFYQLEGEGIRYELVAFTKAIETGKNFSYISQTISECISEVVGSFYKQDKVTIIR